MYLRIIVHANEHLGQLIVRAHDWRRAALVEELKDKSNSLFPKCTSSAHGRTVRERCFPIADGDPRHGEHAGLAHVWKSDVTAARSFVPSMAR
jgi:hypothetical protein